MFRGINTPLRRYRHDVFKEVSEIAYNSTPDKLIEDIENIAYNLYSEDIENFRIHQYRKREIVRERVRLAMGMSLRPEDKPVPMTLGIEESNISDKYYEPPLMQVIPAACMACEENKYEVSNMCKGCTAHPCVSVCPTGAVSMHDEKSFIVQEKCIKCGKCKAVCPYDAIAKKIRPCQKACGVDAIENDVFGRAYINIDKCVSCGMCMVNCPFGAISDKSQIYQLIRAIKNGDELVAEVAPAFVGQFGKNVTIENLKSALLQLGFQELYEVALGADLGAVAEAHHYVEHVVNGELPFMLTSCCPSWSVLAKKQFPELIDKISTELTPMVATARIIKEERPNARVVFIGPCAAKKLEAMRRTVRSDVDFVITFEELLGMFASKNISFEETSELTSKDSVTALGRGYAVATGVVGAIEKCINEYYPDVDVKIEHAEGLSECRKILQLAKVGKLDGYLIEGMGCPGGCVAGAGTNLQVNEAKRFVKEYVSSSKVKVPKLD